MLTSRRIKAGTAICLPSRHWLALQYRCRPASHAAASAALESKPTETIPAPRSWPVVKQFPSFLARVLKSNGCTNSAFHSLYLDFGPICRFEVPGIESIILSNPLDMVTVLQNEGKYPFGSISQVWPLKKFVDENEPVSSVQRKFFDEGEPWREARSALAPAISPPRVAREFLPAIAHASKLASRAAGEEYWRGRFDLFLNHAAFDLFTGLAIGSFPNTCVPGEAGEVYEEFVGVTLNMFHTAGLLFNDPFGKMKRSKYGEVAKSFQRSIELADGISQETVELLRRGEGTQFQKDSFMNKLVQRGMDTQAILESVRVVLQAGVDTTGYVFSWLVLNLAQHPDKQQKLREELEQVLNGDDLTEDKIQHLPFLKACIRESHRLTPPTPLSVMKKPTQQLILCGYEIPPNTTVALNGIPWDPEYVDSPKEYRPERFLPEAVEARKGTKAALLDHRLLSDPFSGGARMCLGARVAQLEILAFSARLFQDWNIEVEPGQKWTTKTFLLNKADPYPRLKLEWLH